MVKYCLIFHGYGSNGEDMHFVASELSRYFNFEISTPDAPFKSEINSCGYEWFPLKKTTEDHFFAGLTVVEKIVENGIQNLIKSRPIFRHEILLCGFSQGAALAVHMAMRSKEEFAGIVSFSGGFANPDNIFTNKVSTLSKICLIHGEVDDVLPVEFSKKAHKDLTALGVKSELNILPNLSHAIDSRAIDIAVNFIKTL